MSEHFLQSEMYNYFFMNSFGNLVLQFPHYIEYYGKERSHQALDYATPYEIFTGQLVRGFGEKYKGFCTRKR